MVEPMRSVPRPDRVRAHDLSGPVTLDRRRYAVPRKKTRVMVGEERIELCAREGEHLQCPGRTSEPLEPRPVK